MPESSESFERALHSAILAFVTGDALGVPVEFKSRTTLNADPVTDMREYGTYNQKKGTWSDDTSMTLCTIESLTNGLNYDDMMRRFLRWLEDGYLTARGDTFDIGVSTRAALIRYDRKTPALQSGGAEFEENGNGSLMRILPAVFYLRARYGEKFSEEPAAYAVIHDLSKLTHAHPISQIACGIYCAVANELINGAAIPDAVKNGIETAKKFYRSKIEFSPHLKHFVRVSAPKLLSLDRDTIRSTGYVLHTLEAALWCLLHTDNLKDCLLTAVNLGDDTDTVAAVTGGLAGIAYGKEQLPAEWLAVIPRLDDIEALCDAFAHSLR